MTSRGKGSNIVGVLIMGFEKVSMNFSKTNALLFCRSIGRDFVFFAGAVVVIRFLVAALDEPPPPGSAPSLTLPGK